MKFYTVKYFLIFLLFSMISCNKDDEGIAQLKNSVWKFEGEGCDSYFDFRDSTYISLNPCYGTINLVAWEAGKYSISGNKLTLTVNESCNSSLIGQSSIYSYDLKSSTLTISSGSGEASLTKVQDVPNITGNIEYGYWDFDNGGSWVTSGSCSSPYN